MDFFTFVIGFTIIGTVILGIAAVVHGSAVESNLTAKLNGVPNFSPTVSYCSSMCKNAIAIDTERKKIAFVPNPMKLRVLEVKPIITSFSDLIAVEVVRDGGSITRTQRGSQIAGAAIGGALLGPAGLIVGGLSGSTLHQSKISKLSIKLYTNDIISPLQEIFFLDLSGAGADAHQIQPILRDLDLWYGRLRAVIETTKEQKGHSIEASEVLS